MTYFNLFSNIMITEGACRMLISDLQRNTSELYPLELYYFIEELKVCSIEVILKKYDQESQGAVQEYLDLLLEKEYGFISNDDWDKNFPPLSLDYYDYNRISNIYVELNALAILYSIRGSIEKLEIKHLVIYCNRKMVFDEFLEIEDIFKKSCLTGIEIYSEYDSIINRDWIQELSYKSLRIFNIVFYKCDKVPFKLKDQFKFTVNFTKEHLRKTSCGKVDLKYFNTNLHKVAEATYHNSCLYKKVGIDIDGNIKNCPSMHQCFGNISNTSLDHAVNQIGFKKYWEITKDKIEVCKDCEFRYICTDCRAYTERTHINDEQLDTSKPLKCGYNPYKAEWEKWSDNPLKKEALIYYKI
ncbi:grasp-with-spasm system SPASM domain peptide maturase [Chryseobacterium fluminis]|uniref:grasp-with-spasm system SPASM domain peptide maturase n=1 Tax=Chryseobacterium fluminis TaxID=2983606 RepID=UPI002257D95D|nr:grasp-with-spasm system SPASM domain peptide maturase [Chryseobacterium sp. MMS21-Ot14]UZT96930.1 grasp-with-spasm system SPASM domain peptide maturase [Chryseobacterium sp. MMS21-Ot14]